MLWEQDQWLEKHVKNRVEKAEAINTEKEEKQIKD